MSISKIIYHKWNIESSTVLPRRISLTLTSNTLYKRTVWILKIRIGIKPEGKVIARENAKIFSIDGNEIGLVTSGTFGPSVNAPVAMGYVKSNFAKVGTTIKLEVRGKQYEGKVSELPFYKKSYVK